MTGPWVTETWVTETWVTKKGDALIKITVKKTRSTEATEMLPPGLREGTKVSIKGEPEAPMPVYVREHILSEMCSRAVLAGPYEVGGFLIGGLHTHEGQRYIDVKHHIASLKAESASAHLTFTNEAQRECHQIKDRDYPDDHVLGWYHTHPGYGVFLSGYDLFLHKQFFTLEWHVALVIDPTASPPTRDVGVFLWQGDQISRPYGLNVYK